MSTVTIEIAGDVAEDKFDCWLEVSVQLTQYSWLYHIAAVMDKFYISYISTFQNSQYNSRNKLTSKYKTLPYIWNCIVIYIEASSKYPSYI